MYHTFFIHSSVHEHLKLLPCPIINSAAMNMNLDKPGYDEAQRGLSGFSPWGRKELDMTG